MQPRELNIRECFDHAIGLDPASLAAYLDSLPAELRVSLQRLLAAHDQTRVFFDEPLVASQINSLVGRRLGPWQLLTQLGQGGMGSVFLAERADGTYQQRVAIKILGHSSLDPGLAAAFHRERQILAQLKHSNIASLLDGGTSSDGLLYLVMELVEGERLDEHVRQKALSTKAILNLFLTILDTVQFAHKNLIVHRDLKPSNIMVTSGGIVKLLDFGIAKSIQQPAADSTMSHRLTPGYASPEQLLAAPATTASDVYSLGVILYELLTGQLPYPARRTSLPELIDAVTKQPPLPPRSIQPNLNRDLELILLKALDKDPQRRYAGASQFADDIRRYLNLQPVLARPDAFTYRAAKFISRNRTLVAFSLVLLIVSITSATLTVREGIRAQRRFNELRTLANSLLFEFDADLSAEPQNAPIRRKITQRGLEYLNRIAAESSGDASLDLELARAYIKLGDILGTPGAMNLGLYAPALEAHQKALEIAYRLKSSQPSNKELDSLIGFASARVGYLFAQRGQTDLARMYLDTAIRLIPVTNLGDYLMIRLYLSDFEISVGNPQAAIDIIRAVSPFIKAERRRAVLSFVRLTYLAYRALGEPRQAVEQLLQFEPDVQALAAEPKLRSLYSTPIAGFYWSLANLYGDPLGPNIGRPCEAVPWIEKARQILGPPRKLDGLKDDNIVQVQFRIELASVLARCPASPSSKEAEGMIDEGMRLMSALTPDARFQFLARRALVLIHAQKPSQALALITSDPGWQKDSRLLYVASLTVPKARAQSYLAKARELLKQDKSKDYNTRHLRQLVN